MILRSENRFYSPEEQSKAVQQRGRTLPAVLRRTLCSLANAGRCLMTKACLDQAGGIGIPVLF